VLDKWNQDATVDLLGQSLGVDPEVINTSKEAQEVRQQRQQAQQQQEQAAQAQQTAETAKVATEAGRNLAESQAETQSPEQLLGL